MGEMKPTPGEWVVESDDEGLGVVAYIGGIGYWVTSVIRDAGPDSTDATNEANARLIAEAGTVFHNTGLSPVQLVEMVREMEVALRGLVSALSPEIQGSPNSPLEIARAALAKCEGVGNE